MAQRKTPAMFRGDIVKLQKQAEKLGVQAHDRGDMKASHAYFMVAHEIEGCTKSLKTVLGRLSGRAPRPVKKKRFARTRKAFGLNPKRRTKRKATKRRPSLTTI